MAARHGDLATVNLLLKAGANPLTPDAQQHDAITDSLRAGHTQIAQTLVSHMLKNKRGSLRIDHYLLVAAQYNDTDFFTALANKNETLASDQLGRDSLWFAASHGNSDLITFILEKNLSHNQSDRLNLAIFFFQYHLLQTNEVNRLLDQIRQVLRARRAISQLTKTILYLNRM